MSFFSRPFLSLKWQVLALTSLLILLFCFGYYRFTIDRAKQAYLQESQIRRAQLGHEFSAVLEGERERLHLLHTELGHREALGRLLAAGDGQAAADAFTRAWPTLEAESRLALAQLYTGDGALLGSWGASLDTSGALARVLASNRSYGTVVCESSCFLLSGESIEGASGRMILLLAVDLSRALQGFEALSRSAVALVLPEPDAVASALWGRQLAYVSAQSHALPVLSEIAQRTSLQELETHAVQSRQPGGVYSVTAIPLPGGDREDIRMLLVADVSVEVARNDAYFDNVMRITAVSCVVMEGFLLFWLWWPTSRLRQVARALPLLAQNRFEDAARHMSGVTPPLLFRDESDMVREASLGLAQQLASMQALLDKRAQQLEKRSLELERERNFALGLLNSAHAVVLTQDADGCILMINHHGAELLGTEPAELVGRSFHALLPADQADAVREQLRVLVGQASGQWRHEALITGANGEAHCLMWFHSRLSELEGGSARLLSVGIDISERKSAEASLGWLASHDALTRLLNRHRFEEELEQMLAGSRAQGQKGGAVLLLDLDHFKDINDSSGHGAGDEMLRKVGQALEDAAVEGELVARLGPDEFGVLIPGVDVMSAGEGADRFGKSLAKIAVAGAQRVHRITASVGVAVFPSHGNSLSELLCNADMALQEAKASGRNAWRIYAQDDAGRERVRERVFWNERARAILNDRSFDLHFQPIVRLGSGEVSHYEALVRVHGDRGQLESPTRFIAAAERTGLVRRLDEVVIERVMACQAALQERAINATIAVNLSAQSFHNPGLVEHIDHCLEHYGADPRSILFEITETAAVEDIGAAWEVMTALRRRGCRFALDDFGVGYCSLQYLKRLPVDYLKIDGSFIRSLHENPDDRVVVKGVIEIARAFGLRTIAEFVDSQAVWDCLTEMGVDYAQGYHIDQARTFVELWGAATTQPGEATT